MLLIKVQRHAHPLLALLGGLCGLDLFCAAELQMLFEFKSVLSSSQETNLLRAVLALLPQLAGGLVDLGGKARLNAISSGPS